MEDKELAAETLLPFGWGGSNRRRVRPRGCLLHLLRVQVEVRGGLRIAGILDDHLRHEYCPGIWLRPWSLNIPYGLEPFS